MTHHDLEHALNVLVAEHGFETVRESLHSIRDLNGQIAQSKSESAEDGTAVSTTRKRSRLTAPEYVAKMGLPPDREEMIAELAERFHAKSFLPSFGDVTNFCRHYDIDVPASRSRVSAIARVFKFLATMDPEDAREIADYHMFSGPSSLGPIADAIRRNGRARTRASRTTDASIISGS